MILRNNKEIIQAEMMQKKDELRLEILYIVLLNLKIIKQ